MRERRRRRNPTTTKPKRHEGPQTNGKAGSVKPGWVSGMREADQKGRLVLEAPAPRPNENPRTRAPKPANGSIAGGRGQRQHVPNQGEDAPKDAASVLTPSAEGEMAIARGFGGNDNPSRKPDRRAGLPADGHGVRGSGATTTRPEPEKERGVRGHFNSSRTLV